MEGVAMMVLKTTLAAVAVLGCTMATQASAQSNADVARQWGLLGTWMLTCADRPTRDNPELSYELRGGRVVHVRNFGGSGDTNEVALVSVHRDGAIELLIPFGSQKSPQWRQFSVIKGPDGRIRAVSNRDVNTDQYSVRDGVFTFNDRRTPWQTRCR